MDEGRINAIISSLTAFLALPVVHPSLSKLQQTPQDQSEILAVVSARSAPDAASMTAFPRPSRLALTLWVTPDTYTVPVPDDASVTMPTLPPKTRSPVLTEPLKPLGSILHAVGVWGCANQ